MRGARMSQAGGGEGSAVLDYASFARAFGHVYVRERLAPSLSFRIPCDTHQASRFWFSGAVVDAPRRHVGSTHRQGERQAILAESEFIREHMV